MRCPSTTVAKYIPIKTIGHLDIFYDTQYIYICIYMYTYIFIQQTALSHIIIYHVNRYKCVPTDVVL